MPCINERSDDIGFVAVAPFGVRHARAGHGSFHALGWAMGHGSWLQVDATPFSGPYRLWCGCLGRRFMATGSGWENEHLHRFGVGGRHARMAHAPGLGPSLKTDVRAAHLKINQGR